MVKKIPRYLYVYNSLKTRIESTQYRIGDYLPPEPELEKQYHVSRTTVRKAVELLAQEGFVHIQQGKGTSILDYKATQMLQYVTSFSETLKEQGFEVSHKVRSLVRIKSPEKIALELKILPGSEIIRIRRLAYANRVPIAIMENFLLPDLVPEMESQADNIGSLYKFLESQYELYIGAATDCISAVKASPEEAALLELPEGEPLLIVHRISFRKTMPIEVADLKIIAEKYEYSVHMKERPPRSITF